MSSRSLEKRFAVGDKVRLTGKFLRNTGQYTGQDAHSTWEVVGQKGDFVAVNEPASDLRYWTPEEIESLKVTYKGKRFVPRKFHAANLQLAGKPDYTNL